MPSYLTSDTLIASVKRRAHIPESQVTFQDDDLLAFANEETLIGIVPSIMKMHEEFYVYPFTVPLVSNQANYEIPDRAVGTKVRTLFYQDSSSNLQEMARINPEDLVFYQNRSSINYPRAFYLENNNINIVPSVSDNATGNLLVKVFLRPNQLVASSRISTVQSVNTTTGEVVINAVPSVFTVTSLYDFVEVNRGHKTKGLNLAVSNIDTGINTITFDPDTLPSDLAVGDLLTLAGETNIPQMPDELHSVLAQRVACRCLEAQKDLEGLQAANAKLQEMEINLGILIDNRTEGQPQKVNNLRSVLRAGKFRYWRRSF